MIPRFLPIISCRRKSLQANVKLLPLLRKDVQVKKLILHEPGINIIRNRQGVYNFATLGGSDKKKDVETEKNTETEVARDKASANGPPF